MIKPHAPCPVCRSVYCQLQKHFRNQGRAKKEKKVPRRIRKKFTFEAAHQLETAFTKACHECIHGHSYTVEMFLDSDKLDDRDMVLDFGELKEFKDKVMEAWDHGLILHTNKRVWIEPLIKAGILKESKVTFLLRNPTAEVMAEILFHDLTHHLATVPGVYVAGVRVHETGTGWAEFIA